MHQVIEIDEARRVTRQLLSLVRQIFAPPERGESGLPLGQLRLCAVLAEGPRSMSEVARELRISTSAATQLADRLERGGLVRRLVDGPDRRVRRLALTARALGMMQRRQEGQVRRMSSAWQMLTKRQRRQALSTFVALARASQAALPQSLETTSSGGESRRRKVSNP